MNVLVYLGHPAHFHMLKHAVQSLRNQGARVDVLIKRKDILEQLLQSAGWEYVNILPRVRKGGALGMVAEAIQREVRMWSHARRSRPDVLVGTSAEIAHVGAALRRPSIVLSEDDAEVIPLLARIAYPFATAICSPHVCSAGRWEHKKVSYAGYQKLAYLHPIRFQPEASRVAHLTKAGPYSIIRLVRLTAHHDFGIGGFQSDLIWKLIRRLEARGSVYISAEGTIAPEFAGYRLPLEPEDIHHALSFAELYIGDSQSMAVEAAVLGTPSLRFSDFVGRISVLEELEHRYGLTLGFTTGEGERLLGAVDRLLSLPDLGAEWRRRREVMLRDKVDVSAFWTWLISHAPESLTAGTATAAHERFRAGRPPTFDPS